MRAIITGALVALCIALPAHAAITFVASNGKDCTGAASPCQTTMTTLGGDTIAVFVSYDPAGTAPTVSDSFGNPYTKMSTTTIAGDVTLDAWVDVNTSISTFVRASWTGTNCCVTMTVGEYSGPATVGNIATPFNAVAASPVSPFTLSVGLQQSGNYLVGAFGLNNGSRTLTATSGTSRCYVLGATTTCGTAGTQGTNGLAMSSMDATAASITTVSTTATVGGTGGSTASGVGVGMELCQSNPCAGVAPTKLPTLPLMGIGLNEVRELPRPRAEQWARREERGA